MLRRGGEVFFLGTAMGDPPSEKASQRGPVISPNLRRRQQRTGVAGGAASVRHATTPFPQGSKGSLPRFRFGSGVDRRLGQARKWRQLQRQLLRYRLADIDRIAGER